jgi:hypothetical protein
MDMRLRQAKANNKPFGGLTLLLSGNIAQLPPVQGSSLWDCYKPQIDDALGHSKYVQYFTKDIELVDLKRVEKRDKDTVSFLDFCLGMLSNGLGFCLLPLMLPRLHMGMDKWKARGFQDPDLMHLYTTNREVRAHGPKSLKALSKPILLIEMKCNNKLARQAGSQMINSITCIRRSLSVLGQTF